MDSPLLFHNPIEMQTEIYFWTGEREGKNPAQSSELRNSRGGTNWESVHDMIFGTQEKGSWKITRRLVGCPGPGTNALLSFP